ncbi:aminotransferase class IV family protein [Actinoalloteichus caeruleus]|uniref:aminotransferase class IV family protein n=1 Tax=Actinoalloteichus cyanogriseus TaxID=2893586 RepID=UPI003BB85FB7
MQLNGVPPSLDQIKALALTNYGHFTSMLAEGGRVRGLSLHMQRLAHDCRLLFDVALDVDRVRDYLRRALSDAAPCAVARVTVYDPGLDLGTIGSDAVPHVLVTTRPATSSPASPLRLQTSSYRRELPAVKHIGLFGALRCRRTAQREGYDDVLFLNPDGTISELATSNIGFVRGGQIIWPHSEWLPGVTMKLLNQVLKKPARTERITISDLSNMEFAFATNAATGVRPVLSIGGHTWPTHSPLADQLKSLYLKTPKEGI